jgi:hypothetical protein
VIEHQRLGALVRTATTMFLSRNSSTQPKANKRGYRKASQPLTGGDPNDPDASPLFPTKIEIVMVKAENGRRIG